MAVTINQLVRKTRLGDQYSKRYFRSPALKHKLEIDQEKRGACAPPIRSNFRVHSEHPARVSCLRASAAIPVVGRMVQRLAAVFTLCLTLQSRVQIEDQLEGRHCSFFFNRFLEKRIEHLAYLKIRHSHRVKQRYQHGSGVKTGAATRRAWS